MISYSDRMRREMFAREPTFAVSASITSCHMKSILLPTEECLETKANPEKNLNILELSAPSHTINIFKPQVCQ